MNLPDHYGVLGVARTDPPEAIRARYRELVLRLHPDKAPAGDAGLCQRTAPGVTFEQVSAAWKILRDPSRRATYDRELGIAEARAKVAVASEVHVDDMDFDEASLEYSAACRCGSRYSVAEDDLECGRSVVQCVGCSLHIRITGWDEDG